MITSLADAGHHQHERRCIGFGDQPPVFRSGVVSVEPVDREVEIVHGRKGRVRFSQPWCLTSTSSSMRIPPSGSSESTRRQSIESRHQRVV